MPLIYYTLQTDCASIYEVNRSAKGLGHYRFTGTNLIEQSMGISWLQDE
ncbi:MAG: hypothetical protein ACOCW1_03780 [Chitinispirillaceae bacterium]